MQEGCEKKEKHRTCYISFAIAELYLVIACLFHRFDLQLYDTIRQRDIDAVRDCFIGEASTAILGVRVKNTSTNGI